MPFFPKKDHSEGVITCKHEEVIKREATSSIDIIHFEQSEHQHFLCKIN